jgi:YegS C-terminal NAD kinase beta sandwich-like domain
MPVRPGEAWGTGGAFPPDGVVVRSDAEARAVVEGARRDGREIPTLGLLGGDLCRTLGGTGDERRLQEGGALMEVDVGAVLLDGRLHWFVAHLVARRGWLRGPIVAMMNAQFLGEWDVAPRAHPGDGKLDRLSVSMHLSERLQARTRLPSGTHVPHPRIAVAQVAHTQLEFEKPTPVRLDGEPIGEARSLTIRVEPAALRVVV